MRRFVDESDPMNPVEKVVLEAGDEGTPEAEKLFKKLSRRYDVRLTLKDYRAAYEKVLAEVNRDEAALAEVNEKDRKRLARRRADLSAMRAYINYTEKAVENRRWKGAVLNGIQLGIAAHIALKSRLLEPETLSGRKQQKGRKRQRSDATEKKESNYGEYVSEFLRITSSTRFSKSRAIQEVMKKFSKSESTIRRALKEHKKLCHVNRVTEPHRR